jgi:hypothetical protein
MKVKKTAIDIHNDMQDQTCISFLHCLLQAAVPQKLLMPVCLPLCDVHALLSLPNQHMAGLILQPNIQGGPTTVFIPPTYCIRKHLSTFSPGEESQCELHTSRVYMDTSVPHRFLCGTENDHIYASFGIQLSVRHTFYAE